MGAPKGNQYWKLRSKHGRDKLFASPQLLLEAAYEYFQWCDEHPINTHVPVKAGDHFGESVSAPLDRPYTLHRLCMYLDCSSSYFRTFKSIAKEKDQDFLTVIHKIEDIIYANKFEGATVGIFNHNIIARDLGLSDKQDFTSSDGSLKPNIIVSDKEVADELKKLLDADN